MLPNLLHCRKTIPLYLNIESENVFNLTGEQRNTYLKWETPFVSIIGF